MLMLNTVEKNDIDYIHKKALTAFNKFSGKVILITGANGFLGYYFIKSILAWNDGHKKKIKLILYSRFKNGFPVWLKKIQSRADLSINKKDVINLHLSVSEKIDYIIHCASIASPIVYRQYPIETMKANVEGLSNLLEYAKKRNDIKLPIDGILYFSSSEIYGDPTPKNIPTYEEYRGNVSCTGPRACYDESKRYCETLAVNYAGMYDIPVKIARPFNNYGPGLRIDDGRVIPDFAKNILGNKNIMMFSDGSPKRTFCYVADAIAGYLLLLTKGKKGESYNIGVEKPEISIRELAGKMINIGKNKFNYKGKISFQKSSDEHYLLDNPQRRCPKINKAKKELGYNPGISLDEGLYRTLSWYQEGGKDL